MLEEINIRNFAIIDAQTVPFSAGFNVMSGETGAGKSILIDALGLQLGDRADSSWIRHGQQRCDIQSTYHFSEHSAIQQWLQDNEFDEEHGSCQLRRTLSHNGKSKCYVNAIPTTLSNTKILGEMLVDIHGQHAHQSLMTPEKQIELLDRYSGNQEQLSTVKQAFHTWQQLIKQKRTLQSDDNGLCSQRELLIYQKEEIDTLEPVEGEFQSLSQQQKQLTSAHQILALVAAIEQQTTDDHSVREGLTHLVSKAEQLTQLDAQSAEISELLNQALIYLDEANSTLNHYAQNIDVDPEKLSHIESRMSTLHDVARKHNIEPDELPVLQQRLSADISKIESDLQILQDIDANIAKAEQDYQQHALLLSQSRKESALSLSDAVDEQLALLSLENARFSIQFTEASTAKANGIDTLQFFFAPNPGQGAKPLHKIASGGELSRISLAIQVASVATQKETTLIFDEVDSGIGGATAEVVGRLLKTLSRHNQVICVTHLAQVAAFADQHLKISKEVCNEETFTQFARLSETDVLEELARMSGGINPDKKTREHAKKLRENAIQFSETLE